MVIFNRGEILKQNSQENVQHNILTAYQKSQKERCSCEAKTCSIVIYVDGAPAIISQEYEATVESFNERIISCSRKYFSNRIVLVFAVESNLVAKKLHAKKRKAR